MRECIQLIIGGGIHNLVLFGVCSFLADIIGEYRSVIGKHIIKRKLSFGDRDKPLTILHIMNAIDGDTTSLDKSRTERHLRPYFHAIFLKHPAHHIGFQWEMTAQTGIAPADEDQPIAEFAVYFQYRFHGRANDTGSLFASHRPRIGEHIKERLLVLQSHPHGVGIPLRNQQTTMHGLYACGVIIEDDEAIFFIWFHSFGITV